MHLTQFQIDQEHKRREAMIWQAGHDNALLECQRRVDRSLWIGVAVGSGMGVVLTLLVAGWLL